jgi:tetratricopeptide (TPR) repeat protein
MRFPKTLTFFTLVMGLVFALSAWAQQRPLTQDQVQSLVRSGLGDETGAKAIEQRGIDFTPAEDFMQSLKAAGASEAFLTALRGAKPPEHPSAKKPLNQVQVFALLVGQVPSHRVSILVQERGIDFEPTDDYLQEVRLAGGEDELISALKGAKLTEPATVDPAAQARQAEVRQHVARGSKLLKEEFYPEAEKEFRAALLLDPENAYLHYALGHALLQQKQKEAALPELREAVRLDDDLAEAHYDIATLVDHQESLAHVRKALSLRPDFAEAHVLMASLLEISRPAEPQPAIAEYREAIRLRPDYADAYLGLSYALHRAHDDQGAVIAAREAVRLSPSSAWMHEALGSALENTNDFDGAFHEYQEALRYDLSTGWPEYHLGRMYENMADMEKDKRKVSRLLQLALFYYRNALDTAQSHHQDTYTQMYRGFIDALLIAHPEMQRVRPPR